MCMHASVSVMCSLSVCVSSCACVCCSAKDVVFRAIAAGKHVVTANKALIAAFLPELQALLDANPTVR